MGAEDDLRAMLDQILNGGQSTTNPVLIRDMLIRIQRHIEVAADQYLFPGYLNVLNCLLCHVAHSFYTIIMDVYAKPFRVHNRENHTTLSI